MSSIHKVIFAFCLCGGLWRATEQRINLKFLYELDKSTGKNHAMLKQMFEDETMTLKAVYVASLKI